MKEPISLCVVLTTVDSASHAERLATDLIDRSLAACVQVDGPMVSHYRWAGNKEQTDEYRLTIKTTVAVWPMLRDRLNETHPYAEPQILMLPVADSTPGYQAWVNEQTIPPDQSVRRG